MVPTLQLNVSTKNNFNCTTDQHYFKHFKGKIKLGELGKLSFCPDLASYHYLNATKKWYEQNDTRYVIKEINTPNTSNIRFIEKFWAITKKDSKKAKQVRNIENFKEEWNKMLKDCGDDLVNGLMRGIRKKLLKNLSKKNYNAQ